MTKKITIQHYYTTGSTAAPQASALTLGEIAISAGENKEGIYFKNSINQIVKVPTTTEIQTTIQSTVSNLAGNGLEYKFLAGESSKLHIGAGTGISVGEDVVGISTEYQNKISSGVTAYGWGNHASIGYAKNSTLTAHTGNTTVHITANERADWNKAKDDIDAFMVAAESGTTALDTLKEIQDFLTSDDGTVQTLLDNLSALTDTVSGNTDSISGLSVDVNMLKNESANYIKTLMGDDHIKANKVQNQIWQLTHASASTQSSAITATNPSTALTFGDNFNILNKVAYDKNGHVVSGNTQTLKLPTIVPQGGLTGATGTTKDGIGYVIGHENKFFTEGKSTEITLNFNESFKIPIIDYQEQEGRDPMLTGVDGNGHLINEGWTLATFSLPNIISCGTY